jgi:hypothetical protein
VFHKVCSIPLWQAKKQEKQLHIIRALVSDDILTIENKLDINISLIRLKATAFFGFRIIGLHTVIFSLFSETKALVFLALKRAERKSAIFVENIALRRVFLWNRERTWIYIVIFLSELLNRWNVRMTVKQNVTFCERRKL